MIKLDSHVTARQSPLSIDVEPLNADIALTIDNPRKSEMLENTPQVVGSYRPTEPAATR
ncbi:MAG: hypothetical protein R6X18_04790 [Chloroflexota bacterium]